MITLLKKKLLKGKKSNAVVLMYHHVSEYASDPWDLCVTPANFDDQIRVVKENFEIIPMRHLADRLVRGERLDGLASITFDDGYLDNFTYAREILIKHNAPATFFLTTLHNHSHKQFWWDELEQLVLHEPVLPEVADLTLRSKQISIPLAPANILSPSIEEENRHWRYDQSPPNPRIALFLELSAAMKEMTVTDRNAALNRIREWAGVSLVNTPPVMTENQIKILTDNNLFDVGSHSVNHPALGFLSVADQEAEIVESRDQLTNILTKPLSGFAYPHGHYNEQTPRLVKEAGFKFAVITSERFVTRRDSPFEIPRIQARDLSGEKLLNSLSTPQHS